MEDGLEGRLDQERILDLERLLDETAIIWRDLSDIDENNLFLYMGAEYVDENSEQSYISFNSRKLKKQYGFTGSSKPESMLLRYKQDLRDEFDKKVLPLLAEHALSLSAEISGMPLESGLKNQLKRMINPGDKENSPYLNFSLLREFFEVGSSLAHDSCDEIALRSYISFARDLIREYIPIKVESKREIKKPKKDVTKKEIKKPVKNNPCNSGEDSE